MSEERNDREADLILFFVLVFWVTVIMFFPVPP
jgi:hypothetical protein